VIMFPIWREFKIPVHHGAVHLVEQVSLAGMHMESWAKDIVTAFPCRARSTPRYFLVGRISSVQLGFAPGSLVKIKETKAAGKSQGLRLLDFETTLAIRLGYTNQPREWMRVAIQTHIDSGGSHLDLAIVNDGERKDIRTNWSFPENQFQAEHEWLWELI